MDYYELSRTVKKLNRIYYAKIIAAISCAVLGICLSLFVVDSCWISGTLILFVGGGACIARSASTEGKRLVILEPKKREYEKRKEEEKRRNTIHL